MLIELVYTYRDRRKIIEFMEFMTNTINPSLDYTCKLAKKKILVQVFNCNVPTRRPVRPN